MGPYVLLFLTIIASILLSWLFLDVRWALAVGALVYMTVGWMIFFMIRKEYGVFKGEVPLLWLPIGLYKLIKRWLP